MPEGLDQKKMKQIDAQIGRMDALKEVRKIATEVHAYYRVTIIFGNQIQLSHLTIRISVRISDMPCNNYHGSNSNFCGRQIACEMAVNADSQTYGTLISLGIKHFVHFNPCLGNNSNSLMK